MTIKVTKTATHISIQGEYNTAFIQAARNLGGKWNSPSWIFDIREQDAVLAACRECYGTDGESVDLVDVKVTIPEYKRSIGGDCSSIDFFGRPVARAFGRDSGAKTMHGVVVLSGGFCSGGSAKNWVTCTKENTVFIMRDVSRALVKNFVSDYVQVEIIQSEKSVTIDRDALRSELEKIESRRAEIIALLAD